MRKERKKAEDEESSRVKKKSLLITMKGSRDATATEL
jgi:hypothetical protein